jgi:hypothetical protein
MIPSVVRADLSLLASMLLKAIFTHSQKLNYSSPPRN